MPSVSAPIAIACRILAVGLTNNRPYEGKASWDVMFEVMIPLQQSSRRAKEREAEYLLMASRGAA